MFTPAYTQQFERDLKFFSYSHAKLGNKLENGRSLSRELC
jgi:hypothetical protein